MGSGHYDAHAYRAFSASTVGKSTDEVYESRRLHKDLNPHGVVLRESRDLPGRLPETFADAEYHAQPEQSTTRLPHGSDNDAGN